MRVLNWPKNSFRKAAWAPLLVFGSVLVAEKGFNLLRLYPWLDVPIHFAGGFAITYFFRVCVAHSEQQLGSIPMPIQRSLSIGLTAIAAIIWEICEYLSDIYFGTFLNHGIADTLSDLFFGLFGAISFVIVDSIRVGRTARSVRRAT
jgi:hypothetical protein